MGLVASSTGSVLSRRLYSDLLPHDGVFGGVFVTFWTVGALLLMVSALTGAIEHIVRVGSSRKVLWVNALTIVAGVHDKETFWNLSL